MKALRLRVGPISVALGVVALLAAAGYYLVVGELDLIARILVGVGAAFLIFALLEGPETVERAVTGRAARYGANAMVLSLAVIGILVLVNYIAANRPQRWDWTAGQQLSLSPQTIGLLTRLDQPVQVKLFFASGDQQTQRAEDLIKEYAARTDKIQYEIVDPDLNPGLAQQLGIRSYGSAVFIKGDKRQETNTITESAFTGALLRVVNPIQRKVYFITGHDELDVSQETRDSASGLKQILEHDGYSVEPLTIAVSGTIPSDASAIVLGGPRRPLLEQERQAIRTYLQNGGRALVLRDVRFGASAGLDEILKEWGIQFKEGVAVDPRSALQNDPSALVVGRYPFHDITQPLRSFSILPLMGDVSRADDAPKDVTVVPLLQTTENGWLETDTQRIEFNEGKDTKGPITVAVAVQKQPTNPGSNDPGNPGAASTPAGPTTRLVVFGGAAFATNQVLSLQGPANIDLFANSVNWLTESEDLLSIRPKEEAPRQLTLTGVQSNFVLLSSVVFLPLVVLLIGTVVWWNRR